MATLTVQVPASGGTALSFTAADGDGDEYANTGREVLVVNNASASAIDVTIAQQSACSQGLSSPTHDVVTSVAAGTVEYLPPVARRYNDADGNVQVSYSDTTSVTVAVLGKN